MYEKRIQHEGLHQFRVVRGATPGDVELKARAQLAAWNTRWAAVQSAQRSREQKAQKAWHLENRKSSAVIRTRELQQQIAELSTILKSGLERPPFRWDFLKDSGAFSIEAPTRPMQLGLPNEPDPVSFAPRLTGLDRILSGRRARKETEAATRLAAATSVWKTEYNLVEQTNLAAYEGYRKQLKAWGNQRDEYLAAQQQQNREVDEMETQYQTGDQSAVEFFCWGVLNNSQYPDKFPQSSDLCFEATGGILILDYELPNQNALPAIKEVKYVASRDQTQEVSVSDAWLKRTYDEVLYQISLRSLHELFNADTAAVLKGIVFNGWVHSIDRATGSETHSCILSVQVSRDEFLRINLSLVDPKACFRSLKGIASSKLAELTPIRPIVMLDKNDHRFVEAYSVVETLDTRTNLAAMDWLDFENLIRELFEKEFSKTGGEVKITQASRDGGVDAIAFDPDPIRGGKIVIQAKRYTNVVGVSAVRDLYGTVHNEGATKGILVTTSTYGPDAYDFAKGKPLTLLSGGELLSLLATHGHSAKIDLKEAKAALEKAD